MIKVLTTIAFIVWSLLATAQKPNPHYNKALADSVGADEYGMKSYVLVILKTGDVIVSDKQKRDSLFRGHMDNIGRLANSGKLVIAGPLEKNENKYEGIFVLNVKTIGEAQLLVDTDPAIKAGLLKTDLYSWYGSAALPLYLPYHEKVGKMSF